MTEKSTEVLSGENREDVRLMPHLSTTTSKAPATSADMLGVFQLEDEDGWSAGVCSTSEADAIRHWNTEISNHEYPLEAKRIPASREVRISWIDDKPDERDVPEGGRIESVPSHPEYLSVVATASQWCAYYAKSGRDFFVMWEAEW